MPCRSSLVSLFGYREILLHSDRSQGQSLSFKPLKDLCIAPKVSVEYLNNLQPYFILLVLPQQAEAYRQELI